jgi:hypothetical protein
MSPRQGHALCLWLLFGAFAFRVAAQLLQRWQHVAWLPAFSAWQSGFLPYPLLLVCQIAILAWQARLARAVTASRLAASRRIGLRWLTFGTIYFATMTARLVLGGTVLRGHWWFDAPLPSTFHLVLASYVLVIGSFHVRGRAPIQPTFGNPSGTKKSGWNSVVPDTTA